ncbi:MAG TPA: CPBP family intramembrane glutamic endopeptidase [Cyclobacteriaceae bacterium]
MKPINFIVLTTLLMFVFTMPLSFVLNTIGVKEKEIGSIDYNQYGLIETILLTAALAPLIETFLGQGLPIYLTQKFIKMRTNQVAVFISSIVFSLSHLGYSIWYFILIVPTGILLAMTYIVFQARKESSFWMTFSVHSLRNLIAISPFLLDR